MPGPSGLEIPVSIVRHSGLIICKSGRIYFEAVEREAWLRQLVQGYGGYICRDDSENRLAGRVTGNPAEPTGLALRPSRKNEVQLHLLADQSAGLIPVVHPVAQGIALP